MNKTKVFCIGMFKTGTTSMGRAFDMLGYNTLHGPWWDEGMIVDDWYKTPEKWDDYDDLIRAKAEKYDAFEDYPWMFCYKKCDVWFPGSKFILLERDADKVAESDLNMWRANGVKPEDMLPKQAFIDRYQKQFDGAVEYFKERPDDLLIMNLSNGDGFEKMCEFLGKNKPVLPFPHANKGSYL